MMDRARDAVLVVATITMGLITGVFSLYSHTVMPGLADTDDRTFVAAFQSIDESIVNPWFMAGGFVGALAFTALAAALHLGRDVRVVLPWIVAALVSYLVAFGITLGIHVPLNDEIKGAGDVDQIDNLAAVRRDFDEPTWTRWNNVRTVVSLAAFGCLTWALLVRGRTTRDGVGST